VGKVETLSFTRMDRLYETMAPGRTKPFCKECGVEAVVRTMEEIITEALKVG
jgi:hypothetical protein